MAEHHVGGDEELVDGRVVGRAEGGADETCATADGVAAAFVGEGLSGGGGDAFEGVGLVEDAAVR